VALGLAKALGDTGATVEFLLMSKEGELLSEAEKNFTVIDLKCDRTYKLPLRLLAHFIRRRPDVLISSYWKLNLCSCLARMLFPTVGLLLWEHSQPSRSPNSPKWLYAISASVLYRFANKVVAVSTAVYRDVDQWTRGLHGRLITIFNPIQPPEPQLLLRRKPARVGQLIWVGRLDVRKNPALALEAFAIVSRACNATLVFVGDGPLRPELEQRCDALDLNTRVRFLGYLANPYEAIAASDLLLLSSDNEGLPSVIVEAMYCGLRVVSTDCGAGVSDILLENVYGTIVKSNDRFALAKGIETELNSQGSAQFQIDGAQRFLPHLAAQQFLRAML
jgi:glycosyltransferase involved in cell wall biosynthesis